MPQAIQHRVVLVGGDDALNATLQASLRTRAADVAARCPDLSAARQEAARHPGRAHLFLVHLAGTDVAPLAAFTAALPGQPVVALLAPGGDLHQLLAAQRAGAAQVVPLPLREEDFSQALDCIARQFAPPPAQGRLLALCGVTGGCGATTLALNLAYEIALAGGPGRGSVLLVELSRQMGTLATYLDIEPRLTTHQLLADASLLTTARLRQAMTPVAPGLNVLVGPYEELTPGGLSPRHVYQLVELCRQLARVVVLDVPGVLDDLQFEMLALADQVVLVGVQTVASVRTLKLVRDTLRREGGVQDPTLVINRYESGLPGFSAERLAELLRVPRVHTVVNDYPSVMAALNNAKPLQVATPHSRVLADVRALATALAGAPAPPPVEPADRLARALLRAAPAAPPPPRTLRVLHVEDDPVQQHAMALHLGTMRAPSCTVSTASSEAEALALFRPAAFDVVLLDYHLPQSDGLACLQRLRGIDPMVPIIVVSGLTEPQVAAELLEAGADDFVGKENLSSERLARSVTAAVARADAVRQRLDDSSTAGAARNLLLAHVHQAIGQGPDSELLRSLQELNRATWPAGFRAAQIQRLVDLVCSELGTPGDTNELPRRALLTLFLRLFGAHEATTPAP